MTLEIEDGSEHAKAECNELRRIDPNLKDKVKIMCSYISYSYLDFL